ncbi:SDR family NAD(P)-dependent oxidoreductase [Allonocardiopsis opalescens]|uniref:NAD(P)-dependent dehydrogenase (Short-subunit alcohol dehydrogenase family) n=1 Tax=Allonocardiopsis opalescens TaxID=1144618 RepID=A0A2T0PYK6_9ACTN|nr:SDR family oxidoreductase [Allonocardiopsis opalescens]PRX96592.1 NAD(P)-dependent dehydrogenase (short-subunit alcohol dehydrogenase family) [Allonocardiopsis opalescens]
MTDNDKPLTGHDTIARWLGHPVGAPLIGELLAAIGQDESVLDRVRPLPLNTLVTMSQGRLSQEVVDGLVARANGGVIPAEEPAPAPGARFAGRTVIVTGAASGIGRATAERIIAEEGRVIAVDLAADRLAELATASPEGAAVPVAGDITSDDDIERIVGAAGGTIDGLANVAGIMDGMLPLHELGNEVWDRVMGVNVTGTFKLSRAVLPVMLAAGKGAVVNVASEASLRGNAAGTAYTAAKHAVVGITKSAAFLYGPSGVRTNAVAPGPTATGISGAAASDFGRDRLGPFLALIPPVTTAATLAASITWLLSDDSANVNGQILASDGGWSVQ